MCGLGQQSIVSQLQTHLPSIIFCKSRQTSLIHKYMYRYPTSIQATVHVSCNTYTEKHLSRKRSFNSLAILNCFYANTPRMNSNLLIGIIEKQNSVIKISNCYKIHSAIKNVLDFHILITSIGLIHLYLMDVC